MIRRARESEYEEIKLWSDHFFGAPYLSLEEFRKYAKEPDGFLFVCEAEGEIASAALCFAEDKETLMDDMSVTEEEWRKICGKKQGGRLKFAWTKEAYQDRGYSFETVQTMLSEVKKQGTIGVLFTQLWLPKNGDVPYESTAKKLGFFRLKYQKEPWYKEKYAHCRCILCRGMCRCDAEVYVKEL